MESTVPLGLLTIALVLTLSTRQLLRKGFVQTFERTP